MQKRMKQHITLVMVVAIATLVSATRTAKAAGVDPDYKFAPSEARERFADLKFGMRIVWGQNAVLALNWDGPMRRGGHSEEFRRIYLTQYQLFKPTEFSAEQWADLCTRAGMKYALTTTRMHCGFCLWPTQTTTIAPRRTAQPSHCSLEKGRGGKPAVEDVEMHFDIMDTPLKRDVVRELVDAFTKRDLPFGFHYSIPDWNDPRFSWDRNNRWHGKTFDGKLTQASWTEQVYLQIKELAGNYGPLLQISFDTGGVNLPGRDFSELVKMVKMARKLQPNCLFRNRGIRQYGDYGTPEGWVPGGTGRVKADGTEVEVWEHIDFLSGLWGWWPNDNQIKPKEWLVETLVDVVAKGGNFMPAVSPTPWGTFAPEIVERLEYIGDWLKINAEAIYKTRSRGNKLWKEGEHIRFTRSKDSKTVYAISLQWPGKTLTLKSVTPSPGSHIYMLGIKKPLDWHHADNTLVIHIPPQLQNEANRPCKQAWTFKIQPGDVGSTETAAK